MITTTNGSVSSWGAVSPVDLGLEGGIQQRLAAFLGFGDLAVVARQVADAESGHQGVAALHLRDAPAQRVRGLLHVGDDRREEMRDTFVDRELEHLRVDHDQPDVLGRGLVQEAQHHRVQAHGLTGARGASDQEVRHAREVRHDRRTADVLAKRERERRLQLVIGLRLDDLAERDRFARFVRNLEAHVRLAGNDLDDAHADGRERPREILR